MLAGACPIYVFGCIAMKTEEFNRILQTNGISVFSLEDASRIIGKPKHYTTVFLRRDMRPQTGYLATITADTF